MKYVKDAEERVQYQVDKKNVTPESPGYILYANADLTCSIWKNKENLKTVVRKNVKQLRISYH